MKKPFRMFTVDDVRKINEDVIAGRTGIPPGLSPASIRILRQSRFSPEEINRAFAEALRVVGGK